MSLLQVLDIALAALVLAVAGWTIAAREAFAAVVGFVVYGLLVSIVWVRVSAPDVALTEAAISSGVTGILLITAAARLRDTEHTLAAKRLSARPRILATILSVVATAVLAAVVLLLPDPGPTLAPVAAQHLADTGLGNPVTAVLMAFRSLDTVLEKVVLILAIVGVWSLAPDRFWGGAPGPPRAARPEGTLAFLAQVLAPLGVLIGLHLFWTSANAPGGAFQGGAILSAMWMITTMAGLTEAPTVAARWLRLALIAGPAVFLLSGLAGAGWADAFFAYPPGRAKSIILFVEIFMILSIAVTLAMLVAGPPRRKPLP
jgi:multisubunit Na+/H+ antiporter MnhB subunit